MIAELLTTTHIRLIPPKSPPLRYGDFAYLRALYEIQKKPLV